MEETVQAFLRHIYEVPLFLVYLFFFVSAVLQITFPPYPGDSVLIFGGYFASVWQKGAGVEIFTAYVLGTAASSMILYKLGEWKGESLLQKKMVSRWFPEASRENARKWVLKYGTAALLLCKFIPGLNSLIIFFCGMFKYKKVPAYFAIAASSVIHNGAFFIIGRVIGQNWRRIGKFLSMYNKVVVILVAAAIIAYGGYKVWAGMRKKATDT